MKKWVGYVVGIIGLVIAVILMSQALELQNQIVTFRPFHLFTDDDSALLVACTLASCLSTFFSVMCISTSYKVNKE